MLTLYKMIFYLKFLSHTVNFGQNKDKIDNIKNYNNPTNRIKIIVEDRINRKFREERAHLR